MVALNTDPDFDAITLDGDEPGTKESGSELKKLRDDLKRREEEVARLQKGHEEAERRAFENEDRAYKASVESADSRYYAAHVEKSVLTQAKARADAEEAALQQDLARAIEVADGKRAAELQSKISDIAARRVAVESGIDEAERNISRLAETRKSIPEPPKPRVSADPYDTDQFKNLPNLTQDWLRQHKDRNYLTGKGVAPKVLSAYYAAQSEGLSDDSPAFYDYMDKRLGHVEPTADGEEEGEPEAAQPARTQPKPKVGLSAPVTRSSSDSAPRPGKGFRLKGEFASTAERLGMTPDEYVKYAYEATQAGSAEQRAQAKAFYNRIRA